MQNVWVLASLWVGLALVATLTWPKSHPRHTTGSRTTFSARAWSSAIFPCSRATLLRSPGFAEAQESPRRR